MKLKNFLAAVSCLAALTGMAPVHSASLGAAAANYNVFVFHDFTSSNTDTQGNLAAGGNVNVSNYSVASQISGSNGASLVAGGSVTASNGGVGSDQYGSIYAGSTSLNSFTAMGGIYPQNQVNFAAAETEYKDLSTAWSTLTTNGTTTNIFGSLNLTGNDASVNIFSITAYDLTNTSTINIVAPTGSTVLINVSGTGQTFQNGQVFLNGVDSTDVIYNFYESDAIHLAGSKNPNGSILAAWADITGGYGGMDGQLIAQSYSGNTEFHLRPFDGNIPVNPVPLPAAFWLFSSAFGFLSVINRRSKTTS